MLAPNLYEGIAWESTGQGPNHSQKHASSQNYE